jgi:3-phenylpropionate/trans-cinnamate dioxygenase ferredoxin subunit
LAKYVVATVDEIPPSGRKLVQVAGREIGIFNLGGEFFALRNRCPHQVGPLCEGKQVGLIESTEPGEYTYSRPGEFLRCPWHGWEFDIRSGQSWIDPAKVRVRRYEVTVAAGSELEAGGAPESGATGDETVGVGRLKGPYIAETYPISVEARYVVLEL